MTPREIIFANLNHTGAPRPGMTFDGGRTNDMLGVGTGGSPDYVPKRWTEDNKEFYDDEWGNLWVRMVGGCVKGEIVTPALPSWDGLDDLKMPDYEDNSRYARMKEVFAQPTDKFKLAHIGGWIFDSARYLRKMEVYFMDMALYPDELQQLHSRVAKVYEAKIRGAGSSGADGVMIGEDMGTQTGLLFSPDMFRKFFKNDYTRLIGLAHEYGMKVLMHSCGMNWEIIDDLIDCGIDCFQFDQPALYDMPALAAKFRERKVALWSPTDIQKVLPTGDRAFIESETRRMLDTFDGCLITKNYPDLPGIGVKPEWDMWAYNVITKRSGL
ncbi:MAG: uroporphyrinogen decarboxylase family protein [Lentisphaeria bacterium]|nr:uroporphyrinogen decarboxylase family protein [Lentisphaeria bacterium]